MRIGQFSAYVSVDGVPLAEYALERSDDGLEASCWIASERDKHFRVEWANSQASETTPISGLLNVDGVKCLGKVMKPPNAQKPSFTMAFRDSVSTSTTTRRPFVFDTISLTDVDKYLNAVVSPHLGTISLGIYEVRYDRPPVRRTTDNPAEVSVIHEKLKTGVPHSVHFGAETTGRFNRKTTTSIVRRLVTFVFKYRPFEFLQAEGIVPRVQPASNLPIEILDLTMDTDEEDVDNEKFDMMEIESQLRPTPEPASLKKTKKKSVNSEPLMNTSPGPKLESYGISGPLTETMVTEEEEVKEGFEIKCQPSPEQSPRKRQRLDPEPTGRRNLRRSAQQLIASAAPNAGKPQRSTCGMKEKIKPAVLDRTKPEINLGVLKPEIKPEFKPSLQLAKSLSVKEEGSVKQEVKVEVAGDGFIRQKETSARTKLKHGHQRPDSVGGVKREIKDESESSGNVLKTQPSRDSEACLVKKEVKNEGSGSMGEVKTTLCRAGGSQDRLKREPKGELSMASSAAKKKEKITGAVKTEIKSETSLAGVKKERIVKRDSFAGSVKAESKTNLKGIRPVEVIDLTL
ncbi:hypothetical protein FB45DRAFT_262544 [Roridomyces roridus]|uniref:DUF7918 domain-containing protein n=1 Tax=Roridomyces roridus TaxID=1738132 RepID=A0AAD7B9D7_9AGAR|nr:hypothetical protein FB45DRAFT_262544 [Roridomyces roridus]